MRVVMVGTPTCTKCKSIRPRVEEYCSEYDVEFTYVHLTDLSKDMIDFLLSKGVKSAPAFLVYKGITNPVVVTGDDIFITLES